MQRFVYKDYLYINIKDSFTCNDLIEMNNYFSRFLSALKIFDCNSKYPGDETYLRCLMRNINNYDAYCCALFIVRNLYKIDLYNDSNNRDLIYKVLNYLFIFSNKYKPVEENVCTNRCEDEDLILMVRVAYDIVAKYYYDTDDLYDKKTLDNYRSRKYYVTTLNEDMNTYDFKYKCLKKYVGKYKLFSAVCLPGYVSEEQLNAKLASVEEYALNTIEDDATRVYRNDCISKFDEKLMGFIKRFEFTRVQKRLRNSFDERWDFICCYQTEKYLIISPLLLRRNIFALETMAKWCYGVDIVFKFFFDYNIPKKYKNNYDEYMVYKIVDLLITNTYIVPTIKKKNEYIPRANIGDYLKDKSLCKKLGDIDAVFYSPHTCCIYIVEFKNIQMTPSRWGELQYDLKKMENWEIYRHVRERKNIVRESILEFVYQVFKHDKELIANIAGVRSIILTTTPSFYFYQYPTDEFLCIDWMEFKEKIEKREL